MFLTTESWFRVAWGFRQGKHEHNFKRIIPHFWKYSSLPPYPESDKSRARTGYLTFKCNFGSFQPGPHFLCFVSKWPTETTNWSRVLQTAAVKRWHFYHWQAQNIILSVNLGKDPAEKLNLFLYCSLNPVCLLLYVTKSRSRRSLVLKLGMHYNICMSSVSTKIGFKMNHQIGWQAFS